MEKWKFYLPVFETDHYNPNIRNSPWSGHTNFAYDLVRFMKPKKIVELGTYMGSSFFSFCQAVKDEKLTTECFAIDTWQGDLHSGFYSDSIYQTVSSVVNRSYPSIAKMIRSTFDEAVSLFQDESIDILHIDGYHTFEAVFHDFTTWLPKLAKEGVILFHDTEVRENNFGVYKFWGSIKQVLPHFEFSQSHGLGVLFPKGYNQKFESVINGAIKLQNRYTGNYMKNISDDKTLPLVSILIPTSDDTQFLESSLNSALKQSYSNIEIIISDNGKNNEAEQLVKNKYCPYFKNIRYIKNETLICESENTNKLLELANGEYINYLIDGSFIHDLKIEKMMNYFLMDSDQEIKLVTSNRILIDEYGKQLQEHSFIPLFNIDTVCNGQHLLHEIISKQINPIGDATTVLFRKKDLTYPIELFENNMFKSNLETAFCFSLLNKGKAIYIAEPLSTSRVITSSQNDVV